MRANTKTGKLSGLSEKTSDIILAVICAIILFIVAYPLYYILIASVSNPYDVYAGKTFLLPSQFTLDGYKAVFSDSSVVTGIFNSFKYTIIGTVFSVVVLYLSAYPLSVRDLPGRKFFSIFFIITMYFGGGLIPSYLVVRGLHMTNTIWAMMIPNALSVYNMLIVRAYFCNSIPVSLEEASTLDGAGPMQYLARVVLPLSKPVLAVIALYYMVGHWNDYYSALIYINDQALRPLQSFMRDLLVNNSVTRVTGGSLSPEEMQAKLYLAQTLKYSSIIVATVPMLVVYPFVQKYFVKGVMVGSIKG